MSDKTNYLEDAILNHVLRATAYTSPMNVYAGLFSAAPGEAGGGTELSGSGYSRQAVTFGAPSGGVVANASAVDFTASGADWLEATHVGIFDAASAGNLLYYKALSTPRTVLDGDTYSFAIGALTVGED